MTISSCPDCGSKELYRKDYVQGTASYKVNYDGSEADNSGYYDNVSPKQSSIYVYCSGCDKRIMKWDELIFGDLDNK